MRAIGQAGPQVLDRPVSDFMTKNVVTARKADTTELLMSEMTAHRFRHMPVVETGRLMVLSRSVIWSRYKSRTWRWKRPRRGSTRGIEQLFWGTHSIQDRRRMFRF